MYSLAYFYSTSVRTPGKTLPCCHDPAMHVVTECMRLRDVDAVRYWQASDLGENTDAYLPGDACDFFL